MNARRHRRSWLLLVALSATASGCLIPGVNTGEGDADAQLRSPQGINAARPLGPRVGEIDVIPTITQLNWTAVPSAVAYDVYLGIDPLPPLVTRTDASNLVIRDLPECAQHYWRVVAVFEDGTFISSPTWTFTTRCPDR